MTWPIDGLAWGTVGDWASSATAVVAICLTFYMWRRDKAEFAAERLASEEARARENASMVGCWIQVERTGLSGVHESALVIENRTRSPIYEWTVHAFIDPPAKESRYGAQDFGVVSPNGGRVIIPLDTMGQLLVNSEVEFTFVVADGDRWRRTKDGKLSRS